MKFRGGARVEGCSARRPGFMFLMLFNFRASTRIASSAPYGCCSAFNEESMSTLLAALPTGLGPLALLWLWLMDGVEDATEDPE